MAGCEFCLATYGTLAPGRANAHQLDVLSGEWSQGVVHGDLQQVGWGAAMGYPGLILDPAGEPVQVDIFTSPDLPDHWARLDAFEGEGYSRVPVTVHTEAGGVEAYIYALAL